MPIANCIVSPQCFKRQEGSKKLIELWSKESGISSEHMTINIVTNAEQHGKRYEIMVNLFLPSLWSEYNISLLQTGLAKALSSHFNVTVNEIHIVTSLIHSGMAVEAGNQVEW